MKEGDTTASAQDEKVLGKDNGPTSFEHSEKLDSPDIEGRGASVTAVFENPLAGIPREQLFSDVAHFCKNNNLEHHLEVFQKGALISQDPANAANMPELTDYEREAVIREHTHKWSQPGMLYFLAGKREACTIFVFTTDLTLCQAMCSLAAAVQGMDETANNGANAIYFKVSIRYFSANQHTAMNGV